MSASQAEQIQHIRFVDFPVYLPLSLQCLPEVVVFPALDILSVHRFRYQRHSTFATRARVAETPRQRVPWLHPLWHEELGTFPTSYYVEEQ